MQRYKRQLYSAVNSRTDAVSSVKSEVTNGESASTREASEENKSDVSQPPPSPSAGNSAHITREDSCDVSIRLTRATPEKVFRNEDEIEGREGKLEEGGAAADMEEVDGYDTESLTQFSEREGEIPCNSDNDDDSHTTGSSTSCNTPDPTSGVGELTPIDGITPANSDPKLFHEHSLKLSIREQDERPASCPPLDHAATLDTNGTEELEDMADGVRVDRTEDRRETECGDVSVAANHDSKHTVPTEGTEVGDLESSEKEQESVQGNGTVEGTEAGFDTLPELNLLRDTPQFKALGHPAGPGGRGRGGVVSEEVGLVISPNMVQVVSADGSKVILRRTIRSIVCCTQVHMCIYVHIHVHTYWGEVLHD